jgi:hypothetical protein
MQEEDEQEHAAAARRQEKGKSRVYADSDEEEEAEEVPLEENERGATTNATTKRKKKLLIITTGTRGDVQPFLALGSHQPTHQPSRALLLLAKIQFTRVVRLAALELQREDKWGVAIATHGCFAGFVEVG